MGNLGVCLQEALLSKLQRYFSNGLLEIFTYMSEFY